MTHAHQPTRPNDLVSDRHSRNRNQKKNYGPTDRSDRLSLGMTQDIIYVWLFARDIGLPINLHLTIRYKKIETIPQDERFRHWQKCIDRIMQFCHRHGFIDQAAYVWVRENDPETGGEHLHLGIHIPPKWKERFRTSVRRWNKVEGRLIWDVYFSNADYIDHDREDGIVVNLGRYFGKNCPEAEQIEDTFYFDQGGEVRGKRWGASRNLMARLRAHDKEHGERPLCWGAEHETDPRQWFDALTGHKRRQEDAEGPSASGGSSPQADDEKAVYEAPKGPSGDLLSGPTTCGDHDDEAPSGR